MVVVVPMIISLEDFRRCHVWGIGFDQQSIIGNVSKCQHGLLLAGVQEVPGKRKMRTPPAQRWHMFTRTVVRMQEKIGQRRRGIQESDELRPGLQAVNGEWPVEFPAELHVDFENPDLIVDVGIPHPQVETAFANRSLWIFQQKMPQFFLPLF